MDDSLHLAIRDTNAFVLLFMYKLTANTLATAFYSVEVFAWITFRSTILKSSWVLHLRLLIILLLLWKH